MALGFPGFGQIDRIFADLQRQQAVMMQRVAAMQRNMAAPGAALQSAAQHPASGAASWSYVSSTTTSNGCTMTVQWSSPAGAQGQPQVIRTSSGNCDKAVQETPVHPVADVQSPGKNLLGKAI